MSMVNLSLREEGQHIPEVRRVTFGSLRRDSNHRYGDTKRLSGVSGGGHRSMVGGYGCTVEFAGALKTTPEGPRTGTVFSGVYDGTGITFACSCFRSNLKLKFYISINFFEFTILLIRSPLGQKPNMESFNHHHPYASSTSQIQIRRTSLVIRSPSTAIADISSPYSGAYGHHHNHHFHTHLIHKEEYTYLVKIQRESSSSASSGTRTPSPDLRLPPLENIPSNEDVVIYTEDASTRLSSKVRRRCFYCKETETTAWRRSHNNRGKLLCNKCGLAERKPLPTLFSEIIDLEEHQERLASLHSNNNLSELNKPPPPMSTVPHARSSVLPTHRRCRHLSTTAQKRQDVFRKNHGTISIS
ncbi:hypothetical protein L218DRAFT_1003395 [Marasmius fiardii PR-910]|nr:hypothetical protein L218DRAFT_1003395 [Marasmius fiardii PR-910]